MVLQRNKSSVIANTLGVWSCKQLLVFIFSCITNDYMKRSCCSFTFLFWSLCFSKSQKIQTLVKSVTQKIQFQNRYYIIYVHIFMKELYFFSPWSISSIFLYGVFSIFSGLTNIQFNSIHLSYLNFCRIQ